MKTIGRLGASLSPTTTTNVFLLKYGYKLRFVVYGLYATIPLQFVYMQQLLRAYSITYAKIRIVHDKSQNKDYLGQNKILIIQFPPIYIDHNENEKYVSMYILPECIGIANIKRK